MEKTFNLGVILTLVIAIVTFAFTFGQLLRQSVENGERIERLSVYIQQVREDVLDRQHERTQRIIKLENKVEKINERLLKMEQR